MLDKVIANRYTVEELIGRGSLAKVYRGRDVRTGRIVAIKVIASSDDRTAAMILRERRLLMRVASPAVAAYLDFVVEGDSLIVVLEFLDGKPLNAWVPGRSLFQIVDVFADIARGLADIHEASIVHRDLKPGNVIVLDEDKRGSLAVITDFGLAVSPEETDELTRPAETIVGTPLYMAPETYLGREVTPAVDIFALGVMFYEALVGHPPWPRNTRVHQIASSVLEGLSTDALQELRSHASEDVAELAARMLAPDPAHRPTAAGALSELRAVAAEITRTNAVPKRAPAFYRDEGAAAPRPNLDLTYASRSLGIYLALPLLALLLLAGWRWLGHGVFTVSAAAVLAASGVVTLIFSRRLRRQENERPAASEASVLEPRIRAIERRIEEVGSLSASMAVQVGTIRDQVESGELQGLLRTTLVAVLREAGVGTPRNDVERVLAGLRDIVSKRDDSPWYKRASNWLAVVGTIITILGGTVGLAGATGIWKPNSRPVIRSFAAQTNRAMRRMALEFRIEADDADGDALRYRYEASSGRIEGTGPLALWRADASTGNVVEVRAFVSDAHATASTARSVRVNRAPVVSLRLPDEVSPGGSIRIEANGADEDGDPLTFSWEAAPGRISSETGSSVLLVAPGRSCDLIVRCTANDGFESVEVSEVVRVGRQN